MSPEVVLAYIAATLSFGVLCLVLWHKGVRQPEYRYFAAGMGVLALRELASALTVQAVSKADVESWHRIRLLTEALVPGFWILFSVSFARADEAVFRKRYRAVLLAAFLVPLGIVLFGWKWLLSSGLELPLPSWLVRVGPAGYWLHVLLLLSAVAVLVNLESTLRASSGSARWQIKFFVLGVGALFGVEVFLYSQVLLYSWIRTTLFPFGSLALILTCVLVAVSLVTRQGSPVGRVYPSEALLYNSLTLVVVGVYLLIVSGLVEVLDAIGGANRAPLVAFFVLLATLALAVLLLSNELKQRVKLFVSRHLQRPSYDYRELWDTFTKNTNTIVDIGPLCGAMTKMAVETFGCSVATIWLTSPGDKQLLFGGSTALSAEAASELLEEYDGGRDLCSLMERRGGHPVDVGELKPSDHVAELLARTETKYIAPLCETRGQPTGYLMLGERVTGRAFGAEEFSLLGTLADQAAAVLANRRLTEELQRAKEMEAFQALSTFFIHDLKNLASRLSLAMQNLPAHFDKPEFRRDLLDTMSKSVDKIDSMTSRLSSVNRVHRGLDLRPRPCDLNSLVGEALSGFNGTLHARVTKELNSLPELELDPEQMQKVLTNLVLNAKESIAAERGHIQVRTSKDDGWILLAVSDNGCGMTPEFVAGSLFKPFQTTKKQGLGIGLFHSKKIVEAHGGRIEVETEHGQGSTFKVLLPIPSGR